MNRELIAGVGGWCCRIGVDRAEGRRRIRELLGGMACTPEVPPVDVIRVYLGGGTPRLRIRREGEPLTLARILGPAGWGRLEAVPNAPDDYVDTILAGGPVVREQAGAAVVLRPELWQLYAALAFVWLAQESRRVVTLHCAVCAVGETALVLLGPSGAGKSTLCWALHDAGADYYGDELAFVSLTDRRLTPWARFLNLRPGGVAHLEAPPDTPLWRALKENDPKAAIHLARPERPCPAERAALILLDGFADTPALSPMPGGEATRRVFLAMGCAERSVPARLAVAADILEKYPAFRLKVGRPDPTAALLLRRFGGC